MKSITVAAGLLAAAVLHLAEPLEARVQVDAPAAQQPVPEDAYRDPNARDLVERARARRAMVDTRISGYEVRVDERMSARAAIGGLERLIFRRETASRIEWGRDTVRIELLGAREVQPMASLDVGVPPATVAGMMPALAFDPTDSEMLLRLDSAFVLHPLAPGSEADYRFASGDTTVIRLPDGREVRILELRISARRADPRLINGSFWLDADSHAVVRAAFRLTRARTASASGVSFLAPEVTMEVDHIAIDYGLWDLRWWLPSSLLARGVVRVADMRFPIEYNRAYAEYRIEGESDDALVHERESEFDRPCRPVYFGSVILGPGGAATADSTWEEAWARAAGRVAGARAGGAAVDTTAGPEMPQRTGAPEGGVGADPAADGECDRAFIVSRAEVDLARSPAFTWDLHDSGAGPVEGAELSDLARIARDIPQPPWGLSAPRLQLLPVDGLRYNRVEGLSAAARGALPLGPSELHAELRAGTAGEVGARLFVERSSAARRIEIGTYRRVEATALESQPFSPLGSASSFVLGRDEHDYFRGTGAEVRLAPPASRARTWDLRLFAERQEPLEARATTSVRGWIDGDFETRINVPAERIDQAGATLRVRRLRGEDPASPRARAEVTLHGEAGDHTFARPLLYARLDRPLAERTSLALEATGGTAFGDVPVQRLWQIGGAATVRGHDPASLRGESLFLTRAEVSRGTPARSGVLFADWGWAGDRRDLSNARPLGGVGVGLSLYDHSLRLDLAHGLRGGGLRAYVRFGAAF